MVNIKFRVTDKTTIDDVERHLLDLKGINANEIPFNHLKKMAECLDAEHCKGKKRGGGSRERFWHKHLVNYKHYTGGFFSVHVIHGGKGDPKVRKHDYVDYFLPPLLEIIKIERQNG